MDYRGRWALVTGASAGIGKAFAQQLAAAGANVAMTARRTDRLEALAQELSRTHGVEARALPADLADPQAPERIISGLAAAGARVDILVNNAGYGLPGYYHACPWRAHRDFLEVMLTSYAHLVRLVLPGMYERGYGRIIQVASLAGLIPGTAGHTLYGPSKAFLVSFSQSLAAESEGTGVQVSAVCPGFTYSEFHDVNQTRGFVSKFPKFMFMEARPVVVGALNAVERGHVVYVPGAWNKFVAWYAKALPRPWAAKVAGGTTKKFRRKDADPA
jgi:short-subunit dehydrogenase